MATQERSQTGTDEAASDDPPPTDAALVVEGLSKQFGSDETAVTAVDDVSFGVERGSVVGLLGPNGAGKTTTIKSILGMVLPDSGSVRVEGIDMHEHPRKAYAHVDAMLEGARNDYWRLTVRENLRYFATISGVAPDSVAGRHERLLDQLDLRAKADEPVRDLSRGMKQKVSLASVLATDASVVFLDEPTLGLDVESSLTLRRDRTVILSSHDMDVIEDVCDRVIIMNEGRVIADDSVEQLLAGSGTRRFRVTSPDIDDTLQRRIDERFEVTDVTEPAGKRQIEVATDSDGFYELVEVLRAADVTIDGVTTASGDLEDVFLGLTGAGEGER